jgi:hypothetical protein
MRDSLDPQGLQGLPVTGNSTKFRFASCCAPARRSKHDLNDFRLQPNHIP